MTRKPYDLIAMLAERFPACFFVFEGRRRPLKLKVHLDLAEQIPELSPQEISLALRFYCGNARYLAHCIEGTPRVDLDGTEVGAVTASEAENARRAIAGIRRRQEAKRAERQVAKLNGNGRDVEPSPESKPVTPDVVKSPPPKRLSLSDLRQAALKRKEEALV
jgi:sRNA-binding protein